MTKIIFIDIDGPLIPARALFLPQNTSTPNEQWGFDPCAVGMLNFIYWLFPDIKAVISSHRVGFKSPYPEHANTSTKEFWEDCFEKNGLCLKIHNDWITPRGKNPRRKVEEILDWLRGHSGITEFVVLEDYLNGDEVVPSSMKNALNLFADTYHEGLTYSDFADICKKFGMTFSEVINKYVEYRSLCINGGP